RFGSDCGSDGDTDGGASPRGGFGRRSRPRCDPGAPGWPGGAGGRGGRGGRGRSCWWAFRRRLAGLAGGQLATAASPPPPAATLLITGLSAPGLGPDSFGWTLRAWGGRVRHEGRTAAGSRAAARLLARARVLLLAPLLEFSQPLLHRPLDLRAWRAWLVRPDARPVRADRFGRWVGVGRFGFDR